MDNSPSDRLKIQMSTLPSTSPARKYHLLIPYLEAGLPVCEAANSFRRASSKAAQSRGSSTDGSVTVSRRSRPARAASTQSSAVMIVAGSRLFKLTPATSQISVAVVARQHQLDEDVCTGNFLL